MHHCVTASSKSIVVPLGRSLFHHSRHSRPLIKMAVAIHSSADYEVCAVIRFIWAKKTIKHIENHRELCSVYGSRLMS